MPGSIPKAAKAKEAAIKKEEALQMAVEEFQQTWGLPSALSQGLLAEKHGIVRSTLQAWINGHTSKIESAGQQQKLHPDEEQLLVDYLQETAHWGFPDTLKRATSCANEILCMQLGNPSAAVGKHWINWFMKCHHDKLWHYCSTTLTTVCGGALNKGVVDDWTELLQKTVTDHGIEEECIFSMDETCCFLDKSIHRTWHIGSASQLQQMALRNEVCVMLLLLCAVSS
jgi:Tc5 transposase DNA-binding domain